MLFVAANADVGNISNTVCDSFASSKVETVLEDYLNAFSTNTGVAKCGLTSLVMVKILEKSGLDSYTYNFGFKNSKEAHVVVLVAYRGKLLVFDPYMNYWLATQAGENCGFEELLAMIANEEKPLFSTDSTVAEITIDESQLSRYEKSKILQEPKFDGLFENRECIDDSIYLKKYIRCFECGTVYGQAEFIKSFETRLQKETEFNEFYQAFALKINELSGGKNAAQMNSRVDSLIR